MSKFSDINDEIPSHLAQFKLSSGKKMPVIAFGTGSRIHAVKEHWIITEAIRAGYRHFDTAQAYGTEEDVGKAIRDAIAEGVIQSREDVFVTSKISHGVGGRQRVREALNETLKKLDL